MIIFTVLNALNDLDIVANVTSPKEVNKFNIYYGMNASSSLALEPLDQLDGFLVARFVQNRVTSRFYPFIAGVYEIFNSSCVEEAKRRVINRARQDEEKKVLLENIMLNLELSGEVYTTQDLWGDERYWEIFRNVALRLDPTTLTKCFPNKRGMSMKKFPKGLLGKMTDVVNGELDDWSSNTVYVPAEVAEAVWFKEKLGVLFKIGPSSSESIYDEIILRYDIGIIGLDQPEYIEAARLDSEGNLTTACRRQTVPYIGKRGQNRILFSDNLGDIAVVRRANDFNPSFERASRLGRLYQNLTRSGRYSSVAMQIFELVKLGGISYES